MLVSCAAAVDARAVQRDDRTDQNPIARRGGMAKPAADDALSGLAPLLRVRPELTDFCRFGGAWASSHRAEAAGRAYFHIVSKGSVPLDRAGFRPLPPGTGDIRLLPPGGAHTVRAPRT